MSREVDHRVRLAAFQWLRAQMDVAGEVLPRSVLAAGFTVRRCANPTARSTGDLQAAGHVRGAALDHHHPRSIQRRDGVRRLLLQYAYRGTDPAHPDNRGLRRAMQQRLPLVYFHRITPGQYLAAFPVFIVGDHPAELAFDVAVDDVLQLAQPTEPISMVSEDRTAIRREYVTAIVRRRVHQQAFRAQQVRNAREQAAASSAR